MQLEKEDVESYKSAQWDMYLVAEVYALFSSMKSTEQWMADFQALLLHTLSMLDTLQLGSSNRSSIETKGDLALHSKLKHIVTQMSESKLLGRVKAILFAKGFKVFTLLIRKVGLKIFSPLYAIIRSILSG
jgi:hypothetical protein